MQKWSFRKQLSVISMYENKTEFCESIGLKERLVSTLLETWKAGKSVASLSSETAAQGVGIKGAKAFTWLFLDNTVLYRKSVQFGMVIMSYEG